MSANTVVKVRRQAQLGILSDAFADQAFCSRLAQAIGKGLTLACEQGIIRFSPGSAYAGIAGAEAARLPVRTAAMQGNNTTVVLGERLFLKGYRHLQNGTQPELAIGRYLTDVAKFPNIAPLAGAVEYESADGGCMTLALLQGYVENQGNCWLYTLDYLARFLEECRTEVASPLPAAQAHGAYLVLIRTLGRRTGELHNALGTATGDAAFDPEPVTDTDIADWVRHAQAEAVATLDLLDHLKAGLTETVRETALNLLEQRNLLADRLQHFIGGRQVQTVKTRYHGDYHLGQALLTQNDFVIIDFEGDSARPLSERCRKHSPLKDVASMLLSFSYAAHTAHTHDSAERTEDLAKFEPLLREWETEAGRVFLAAYDEATHGSELLAASSSRRGLLDLFLLEKAFYAVRYELDNRPDRVFIPLRGILALLQQY
jgi:maltose alpha-D-glucosyltransferase / alpha-amylase